MAFRLTSIARIYSHSSYSFHFPKIISAFDQEDFRQLQICSVKSLYLLSCRENGNSPCTLDTPENLSLHTFHSFFHHPIIRSIVLCIQYMIRIVLAYNFYKCMNESRRVREKFKWIKWTTRHKIVRIRLSLTSYKERIRWTSWMPKSHRWFISMAQLVKH